MKALLNDKTALQMALKHYFFADILFIALLGVTLQVLIISFAGSNLFVFSQGYGSLFLEALVTITAVYLSSFLITIYDSKSITGIAFLSTAFAVATILVSIPYTAIFAGINHTTSDILLLKNLVHIIVFYISTVFIFKKTSLLTS